MKTALLFLGLLATIASGAVTLEINGTAYDSITLKTGQSVEVQIVSDDTSPYSAYVGFADAGFGLTGGAILPAAGNHATTNPSDLGYYVKAGGFNPAPTAGIHFIFAFTGGLVGSTTLYLLADDATTVLDTVDIMVKPAELGTAFTYQGGLLDGNAAADGVYDLQFRLFDAAIEGTQLGPTVDVDNIDVVDGYFMAELDFGSDVFAGKARWLQVSVRPYDSTAQEDYVPLSPRQAITASPYALYALNSNSVSIPLELVGEIASPGAVIQGTNTGDGRGVSGISNSGHGVYGSSSAFAGWFDGKGYFSDFLGIGKAPTKRLEVYGDDGTYTSFAAMSSPNGYIEFTDTQIKFESLVTSAVPQLAAVCQSLPTRECQATCDSRVSAPLSSSL